MAPTKTPKPDPASSPVSTPADTPPDFSPDSLASLVYPKAFRLPNGRWEMFYFRPVSAGVILSMKDIEKGDTEANARAMFDLVGTYVVKRDGWPMFGEDDGLVSADQLPMSLLQKLFDEVTSSGEVTAKNDSSETADGDSSTVSP